VYFLPPILYVLFNFLLSSCYHRKIVYDEEGNLLDEKPIDPNELEKRKKDSSSVKQDRGLGSKNKEFA
jgi:hypothetical protein